MAVRNKALWDAIRSDVQKKKAKGFDIADDDSILVDTEEEIEFTHKYKMQTGLRQTEELAWYIIPPGSFLSTTQQILIETLTLF